MLPKQSPQNQEQCVKFAGVDGVGVVPVVGAIEPKIKVINGINIDLLLYYTFLT